MAEKNPFHINLLEENDFIFKVKNEKFKDFLSYSCFIGGLIDKRSRIPQRVFDKYMSFFVPVKEEIDKLFYEKHTPIIDEHIQKVFDYFSKNKGYKFEYINTEEFQQYSLRHMIEKIVPNLYLKQILYKIEKEEFIRMAFQETENYLAGFSEENGNNITKYKMQVISGYIAIIVGYGITNASPLTNDAIFQATRNAFKKKRS